MITKEDLRPDLINEVLKLLGFEEKVDVFLPPLVNDYDMARRSSWRAQKKDGKLIGGKVAWLKFDEEGEKETPLRLRQSAAFEFVLSEMPSREFINTARAMWALSPEAGFLEAYIIYKIDQALFPLRARIEELEEEIREAEEP